MIARAALRFCTRTRLGLFLIELDVDTHSGGQLGGDTARRVRAGRQCGRGRRTHGRAPPRPAEHLGFRQQVSLDLSIVAPYPTTSSTACNAMMAAMIHTAVLAQRNAFRSPVSVRSGVAPGAARCPAVPAGRCSQRRPDIGVQCPQRRAVGLDLQHPHMPNFGPQFPYEDRRPRSDGNPRGRPGTAPARRRVSCGVPKILEETSANAGRPCSKQFEDAATVVHWTPRW